MKKLFFAALVATVAVGGALSTNAQIFKSLDGQRTYNCDGNVTFCDEIIVPEAVVQQGTTSPVYQQGELPETAFTRL